MEGTVNRYPGKTLHVRVDPELHALTHSCAANEGRSASNLVRRAVRAYLSTSRATPNVADECETGGVPDEEAA
jgi:hypothetical protein